MIKLCKRELCPNTIDTTLTNPRRQYCSDECRAIIKKENWQAHNAKTQAKRHEASQGRGVGERGIDKAPRKKRDKGSHSQRWYELRRVLEKHGIG